MRSHAMLKEMENILKYCIPKPHKEDAQIVILGKKQKIGYNCCLLKIP